MIQTVSIIVANAEILLTVSIKGVVGKLQFFSRPTCHPFLRARKIMLASNVISNVEVLSAASVMPSLGEWSQ